MFLILLFVLFETTNYPNLHESSARRKPIQILILSNFSNFKNASIFLFVKFDEII